MIGMTILKNMNKVKKYGFILMALLCLTACGKVTVDEKEINDEKIYEPEPVDNEVIEEKEEPEQEAIDWNHFEEAMSQEDKEDFQEYRAVLDGKEKFYCFEWGDTEYSFDEYLASIETENKPDIEELVLVDLDNQNGKELIINIYEGGGNYLILTRDSGKIYGTNRSTREFEELQCDGKFLGAGGAGDMYFTTMKIDGSGVETTVFGEVHGEQNEAGEFEEVLVVNGERIDDTLMDWMEKNYSDSAEWISGLE